MLLTRGKLSDAQNVAQRALIFSQQTGSRPPRFDAALASARVKAGIPGYISWHLKADLWIDNLRSHPRFQDLVRRVGYPQ